MKRLSLVNALLALAVFAAACTPAPTLTPTPAPAPTLAPFPAPDFALTALDGSVVRLSDLRGGWVIVTFWATWCAPCRDELPALQSLADALPDLRVLAINQRESQEEVRAFVETLGLRFTVLLNPDDATVLAYQVMGLPQTLVVNPEGNVIWRQFGPLDVLTFESQLRTLRG